MDWSLTTPSIANNLDEARTAAFTTKNYEVLHFFSQFLENIYLVHLGLAWTDNSIVSRQEVSHFYHFKCQTQLMFKWLSGLQWLHQVEWTEAWREQIWRDWCSGMAAAQTDCILQSQEYNRHHLDSPSQWQRMELGWFVAVRCLQGISKQELKYQWEGSWYSIYFTNQSHIVSEDAYLICLIIIYHIWLSNSQVKTSGV